MPRSSPPARIESTSITPSTASVVRSTTRTSANSASVRASSSAPVSVTSCPAVSSIDCTRDPNIRSGTSATTRATGLLRAKLAELLAHRLGAPPHRRDLRAAAADLAHGQLARDPGVVEQPQRAVHRGRRGGVAEAVGDEQAPVPVGLRIGLRVAGDHVQRALDVPSLVTQPQVQLEVSPVVGERVDDLLELVGEAHRGEAYLADPPAQTSSVS